MIFKNERFDFEREVVNTCPPINLTASTALKVNTHYGTFIKAAVLVALSWGTLNAYCP
jgi:hypothetical protein